MNHLTRFLFFFAIATVLSVQNERLFAASAINHQVDGQLSLYFADGSPQCSFPVHSGGGHNIYYFLDEGRPFCRILHQGGFIKLDKVPSSTKIWLVQRDFSNLSGCTSDSRYNRVFELKTVKEPTTTESVSTNDIKTFADNSVIVPGLLAVKIDSDRPGAKDERINCIEIQSFAEVGTASSNPEVSVAAINPEVGAAAGKQEVPVVTLVGANGQKHCRLNFVTGVWSFKGNKTCENDQAVALEVSHLPSASNIELYDDYTCDRKDTGNWFYILLRTVKENFSTDKPIDLNVIATALPGTIVAPGLLLEARYLQPSQSPHKKTSCVRFGVDVPPNGP